MANFNPKDSMDKLLLFFVVAMGSVMLFSMGANVHDRDWTALATGAVTVAFFIAFGVLIVWQRIHELKQKIEARDRDIESMRVNRVAAEAPVPPREMPAELKALMEAIKADIVAKSKERSHDEEILHSIIEDTGGFPLTEDRIPAVVAAFHENTDRYVRLSLEDNNEQIGVEFSAKPFVEAAGQPETVTTTTTAPKPITKSQQRRINAQKGLGALTDEEVRAARLEKRRQARAAKKAAKEGSPTTTTTTTLPGQTGLPGVE